MKKITFFLIIILILTTITLFSMNHSTKKINSQGLTEDSKMLYGFVAKEGKRIGQKYHISPCSIGGGGGADPTIWLMSLDFQRYGDPLTKEEARKLIISCLDDYLADVNKDEEIRPYLRNFPFTPKNIKLGIFNYLPDRRDVYHPYISLVAAKEGEIWYFTEDESNSFKYKSEKYETYDEAVNILSRENK